LSGCGVLASNDPVPPALYQTWTFLRRRDVNHDHGYPCFALRRVCFDRDCRWAWLHVAAPRARSSVDAEAGREHCWKRGGGWVQRMGLVCAAEICLSFLLVRVEVSQALTSPLNLNSTFFCRPLQLQLPALPKRGRGQSAAQHRQQLDRRFLPAVPANGGQVPRRCLAER
jgi:hypothetical protein